MRIVNNHMKSLTRYSLLCFFLLPSITFIHIWPLNSVFSDGLTLLLGIIAFVLVLFFRGRDGKLDFSSFILYPAIICAIGGLSLLWGGGVGNSTVYWSGLILTISVGWSMAVSSMNAAGGRERYCLELSVAALYGTLAFAIISLLLYYGIIQHVLGLEFADGSRLRGGWRQPNLTTTTLWFGIVATAFVAGSGLSRKKQLVLFVVFSIPLALAASRLNYPYIFLALLLGGFLLRLGTDSQRKQGRSLLTGAAVVIISVIITPVISNSLIDYNTPVASQASFGDRVSLLDREVVDSPRLSESMKIYNSIKSKEISHIMFGEGLGRYGFFSFEAPVTNTEYFKEQSTWLHSHNLYSMLLVELGLIGFVFALVTSLLIAIRLFSIKKEPEFVFLFGISALLFLHSMVEFPLWYPWFLFVLIAVITPLYRVQTLRLSSKMLMPALSFVVLISFAGMAGNLANQAHQILSIQNDDNPDKEDYRTLAVLGNDRFLGQYATLVRYRKFDPETINFSLQLREVERMLEWRPFDLVAMRKSTLLILDSRWVEACDMVEMMVQRYPRSAPIIIEKAVWVEGVDSARLAQLAECADRGLSVWGKDIATVAEDNSRKLKAD